MLLTKRKEPVVVFCQQGKVVGRTSSIEVDYKCTDIPVSPIGNAETVYIRGPQSTFIEASIPDATLSNPMDNITWECRSLTQTGDIDSQTGRGIVTDLRINDNYHRLSTTLRIMVLRMWRKTIKPFKPVKHRRSKQIARLKQLAKRR
jgi:hypothetical protein